MRKRIHLLHVRLRSQHLRLHTKAHVLIDKMSLWRRSGVQLVPVTHGERLPVIPLPLDARERLVKLATELIDLRLQRGYFDVPHSWTHRGGDGVSERRSQK